MKFSHNFSVLGAGSRVGLSVVLNVDLNEYYCSSSLGSGFKILLHEPHEIPPMELYGIGIANGYETRILTTPIISVASDNIQNTPKNLRRCIHQEENYLKYYR